VDKVSRFAALQEKLAHVLPMNTSGSVQEHVMIVLPSFSLGETALSHYGERVPALEHRYLNALTLLHRIESCHVIYVCTRAPAPEVIESYFAMIDPARRDDCRRRFSLLTIADQSYRPVASKLMDDPDMLERIKAIIAGRPAFIEPWNVTANEVALALALGAPINGCAPELRRHGYKSAGRKLMHNAGVTVPFGIEDVRTLDDVIRSVATVRKARPGCAGVVVKHDDSVSGDGNAVLRFDEGEAFWRRKLDALPDWYVEDLKKGGCVEELISGSSFSSPSVQADVVPGGGVKVLATHEQVLGGDDGQVYMGCRFPAESAYAAQLAEQGAKAGQALAGLGFLGRFSVDFAVARNEGEPWRVYALEMNLRKGGTTHPYAAMRNLVAGQYDAKAGRWLADDGAQRCYVSSDNLVDAGWQGLDPGHLLDSFRSAGLLYDHRVRKGIVPHMLACLAIDGRFGVTAIGETAAEAQSYYDRTRIITAATAARHS
jgi:hypothetical protein